MGRPKFVVAAGVTGEGRPRSIDHPAPAMTGKGTAYWLGSADDWRPALGMSTTNVHDGEYQRRSVHEPAPTITAVARSFRWSDGPLHVQTPGEKGGDLRRFHTDTPLSVPAVRPSPERPVPMTGTTALDLFAGAGGWSLACRNLGIDEVGVENMPAALETRAAVGFKSYDVTDVWDVDYASLRGRFDGLIASPPCQTFSTAGKGAGRKALDDVLGLIRDGDFKDLNLLRSNAAQLGGDERTALVLSPLHAAWEMRPEWIAWEQVPTVLPVWEACADELRSWGYSVWTGNLQAEQYGVPQTRKRAFLIAHREREVAPPVPTHSRYYPRNPTKLDEGVEKWVSMAEALGWERRPVVYRSTTMPNSAKRPVDVPAPTVAFGHDAASAQWVHERPSTTIVGSFKPEIVAAPGYRTTTSRQNAEGSVRVTVQEAGVLQSFPADFDWQGAKTKRYLQVGNAVPPLLAEAVLRVLVGLAPSGGDQPQAADRL